MGDYSDFEVNSSTFVRPEGLRIGSNTTEAHPSSKQRPAYHPSYDAVSENGYRINELMINEPPAEPFKVVVIAPGAAGIDFLHHAVQTLPQLNVEFAVFEKNSDVGGTWFENRYPGCACDIPSASYQFAWCPNPNWTSYYSGSKEIWEYMKMIATKEDMYKYITLRTEVKEAVWKEERSRWIISLAQKDQAGNVVKEWHEDADLLLNGTGFLNAWKWPTIPGLNTFKGKMFHTARYETGYDLKGKRVAVIGSGSSGVQVVASIYKDVSKLYTWVRSPTWITAGFGQKFAGPNGANFQYTDEQKAEWAHDPEKYREYRKMIELELNQRFKLVLRNTEESDEANEFSYKEMCIKLSNNPGLIDKIIPKDFNVSCRRPTPGNGYLECLVGEKTTCYTDTIGGITSNGFLTADGAEVEVDVIICATGFDTSFRPKFPIIGLDGKSISEKWTGLPLSYAAVGVPNVPNYFMYSGPFSPVAQGSVLPLLTLGTKHFLQVIRKMRKEHIRRLSPKEGATKDFGEHAAMYLKRTAWVDPCSSWFKQGTTDGPLVMWPGSRLAFFDHMAEPKYEDYEIEYVSGNRWGYLGNGFTKEEFSPEDDVTFYLDDEYLRDYVQKKKSSTEKVLRKNPPQERVVVAAVAAEGEAGRPYEGKNGRLEEL
ncbi:hypothetical protein VE04_00928 [Pseudogymnoascus sp. 24MN13]|nr:hypothetical protein VE04_00928 [Pseudogymnoascus sp. 24MN13]